MHVYYFYSFLKFKTHLYKKKITKNILKPQSRVKFFHFTSFSQKVYHGLRDRAQWYNHELP